MLRLVGLPEQLFSNKSGRATLITRLAAQGVPEEVGMLSSGHHTANAYGRYDRTKDLKQEAATLVAHTPGMDYEIALAEVAKRFLEEDLAGTDVVLKPLIVPVLGAATSDVVVPTVAPIVVEGTTSSCGSSGTRSELALQAGTVLQNLQNQIPRGIKKESEASKVNDPPKKLELWSVDDDGIDWDAAIKADPKLAKLLGGLPQTGPVALGAGNTFNNCQNCTIQINLPKSFNPSNLNLTKMLGNKENQK